MDTYPTIASLNYIEIGLYKGAFFNKKYAALSHKIRFLINLQMLHDCGSARMTRLGGEFKERMKSDISVLRRMVNNW